MTIEDICDARSHLITSIKSFNEMASINDQQKYFDLW